jgi:hypothetical protein
MTKFKFCFKENGRKSYCWNFGAGKSYNKNAEEGGTMRKLVVVASILSFLILSSCFYIRVDYRGEMGRVPVDEFHKIVPFSSGGTLSLENGNGNIEIHGWETEELEVNAKKTIQLPDRTRFYFYPGRDFAPGIIFDKFENFVKIRTKEVLEDKEAGFVDFIIDVPHSVNLKDIVARRGNIYISEVYGDAFLDLMEGEIVVENFSGSLTASIVHGSVSASLFDLREEDEIVITSQEGNITLSIQESSSARIEAVFPDGSFSSDFEFEFPPDEKKIDVQLGEGGSRISLAAMRGDVAIKKIVKD